MYMFTNNESRIKKLVNFQHSKMSAIINSEVTFHCCQCRSFRRSKCHITEPARSHYTLFLLARL